MSLTFELDFPNEKDWQQIPEIGKKAIARAVEYVAMDIWGNIGREAPRNHGRLASSFQIKKLKDTEWWIYSPVQYARYVQEGTGIHGPEGRPYVIRPVNRRALYWPGAYHPVKMVVHPGMRPNPYVTRATDRTRRRVSEFAQMAAGEVT